MSALNIFILSNNSKCYDYVNKKYLIETKNNDTKSKMVNSIDRVLSNMEYQKHIYHEINKNIVVSNKISSEFFNEIIETQKKQINTNLMPNNDLEKIHGISDLLKNQVN